MKVWCAFISRAVRDSASIVEDSVGGVGARVVWTFCQPGGWRTDAAVRPNDESDNKEESDSSGNHKETALETADVVGYLSDRLNICTTKGHLYLLWREVLGRGRTRVDFRGRTHTSWTLAFPSSCWLLNHSSQTQFSQKVLSSDSLHA